MKPIPTIGARNQFSERQQGVLVVALLLVIVAMAITFGYVNMRAKNDKQYIRIAGEQRMLALQLVRHASEATRARVPAFQALEQARDRFDRNLRILTRGDPDTGLSPSPAQIDDELAAVQAQWQQFQGDVNTILKSESVIRMLSEFVKAINDVMPDLLELSNQATERIIQVGARPRDVYTAGRQSMLGQRIATNVNRVLQGDVNASKVAEAFKQDTARFETVLKGMLRGDSREGIQRVTDRQARQKLQEVQALFETVRELVARMLEKSPDLFRAQTAANDLFNEVEPLLTQTTRLAEAYAGLEEARRVTTLTGYVLGATALAILLWLGVAMVRNARKRFEASVSSTQQQQGAIIQLLNEIETLGDGDLTVHASVNEEITGAIAEAINYAVNALRRLVTAIDSMSVDVTSAAEETQATAIHLARASERQAGQITQVTNSIGEMAGSIEHVSDNARQSAEVAQRSVSLADDGAQAVHRTIEGMNAIRDHIQDTAKRIKRLGESSQEIGDIIELISDIADQTNILALNAAIQASAAGEAGQGFATVADEVQQLAERATQATGQVESLVKAIQMDTSEAVTSMEQSTEQVVRGTRLAEEAGTALRQIQQVAAHLAQLIHNISEAADQQAQGAVQVSRHMNTIKNVTTQNLTGTRQTADLTDNLARQAKELRELISGFKLPQTRPAPEDEAAAGGSH